MGFELLYRRRLCNGYGLTETSPFVTVDLDDVAGPTNTIGKPMPGIDIEIRDEENRPMKQGDVGTLWLRGQNVMYGYYKADDATAELIKDGWLNTGDLAYLDDAGNIVLSGRNKDLIKHKGIKIYPHEIENVLTSHPLISMAAVIGVMDDTDEIPVAYVVTREMREGLETELKELCANNMAAYKVPRHIYVHTELPMTATGKIDKKALRAQREPV